MKLVRVRDICLTAVVLSVFFSFWSVYQDPVVNRDGMLYLQVAQAFADGDWERAVQLYSWPFLGALVAGISGATDLSLELSCHVLNGVLFASIVLAFIALVRQIGGDERHMLVGAIVVVLHPSLNEYRADITRDAGYLAFYLFALLYFFRFWIEPRWWRALLWGALMLVAGLFRIEGLVLLAVVPFVWFCRRDVEWGMRWKGFVQASIVPLVAVTVGVLVWLTPVREAFLSLAKEMRLAQPVTRLDLFLEALLDLPVTSSHVADAFLAGPSRGYAMAVVVFAWLLILIGQTVSTVGPLIVALTAVSWWKKWTIPIREAWIPWMALILLNLLFLVVYVVPQTMLTGRYALPLALIVALVVPFVLVKVYENWRARPMRPFRHNWAFPLIAVLLIVGGIDGMTSFGDTKVHLKQAGAWLKENTTDDTRIYLNDSIVEFYARHAVGRRRSLTSWKKTLKLADTPKKLAKYKYVAFRFRRREADRAEELIARLQMEPVQTFRSQRGDQVLIFKVEVIEPRHASVPALESH